RSHHDELGRDPRADAQQLRELAPYGVACDVRDDRPRDSIRQRGGEARERALGRVAVHGIADAREAAILDFRPLDPCVADVDQDLHQALRTLTSPEITRRRAPFTVSMSSAPSPSMPRAVPLVGAAGSSSLTRRPLR